VEETAGLGELDPVVDALDLVPVAGGPGADPVAVAPQDRQGVGDVLLALGVVGGQALHDLGQQGAVEGVHTGVDLVDRALLIGGVGVLDDAGHGAVGLPHDTAVAVCVGYARRQHGHGVALVLVG